MLDSVPKLREYTGNTLMPHSQSHFEDKIVKEETKIKKIEKQANIFKGRASEGYADLKRHDQVQEDEQKAMWNAHTELGWGFPKIGSVFGRDWRTAKKAVETYKPKKRQTLDSAEDARALIEKCRLEVASYSPVNLLQGWLDKAHEDARTRFYTNKDVEMLYSEARDHHAGPLQLKPFLQVENDPTFELLRQKFPASNAWGAFDAWCKRKTPYIRAFYQMLKEIECLAVDAWASGTTEVVKKGVKGVDWIDCVSFPGFEKRCKLERLFTVFVTCDVLACSIAARPSNPYWAHLTNDLKDLRLRINVELSAVTDIPAKGGWSSGIMEVRAELPDHPLKLTQEFLDELAELQSTEDSLVKALKKLESKI